MHHHQNPLQSACMTGDVFPKISQNIFKTFVFYAQIAAGPEKLFKY
jgi:hypothetical protein